MLLVSLQVLSEIFLALKELSEILSKIYICIHAKCPLFTIDFNQLRSLLPYFRKNTQIKIFMKILPVRNKLFLAVRQMQGRANMTKVIAICCNLANAPKNSTFCHGV
jgi:hypothetical protein